MAATDQSVVSRHISCDLKAVSNKRHYTTPQWSTNCSRQKSDDEKILPEEAINLRELSAQKITPEEIAGNALDLVESVPRAKLLTIGWISESVVDPV